MATEETLIVHPGDIIQGTVQGPQHGHLFLVTETHTRHLGAVARAFMNGADVEAYHRLRPGTCDVVGAAAILPPEVAAARRDSIATQRQLDAERAAAPLAESDDLTPTWQVQVRFNGRTTGSGQVHNERVQADCVEQALDLVHPPVMQHGGSICIVGVTVDEVRK